MTTKHLAMSALLTALLATSAAGFAQDRNHGDDRRDDRYSQRDNDRHDNERHDDRRGDDRRWEGRDNHRFDDRPARNWHRGERLPSQYRGNQYVVDDWRGHHLRQPPRGYHWVQNGSDYVLVAAATGIIADILLNH